MSIKRFFTTSSRQFARRSSSGTASASSENLLSDPVFPWRLESAPPRQTIENEPKEFSVWNLLDPFKRQFAQGFAKNALSTAIGQEYFEGEFLTGTGLAFRTVCQLITNASSLALVTAYASQNASTPSSATTATTTSTAANEPLSNLENMLTPQFFDLISRNIKDMTSENQAIKLLASTAHDSMVKECRIYFGSGPSPKERVKRATWVRRSWYSSSVNLWDIYTNSTATLKRPKGDRSWGTGDMYYQWFNLAWRLSKEELKESADRQAIRRLCMDAMEKGFVATVDVVVTADIQYACAQRLKQDKEAKVLVEEESERRDIVVRFESSHIELPEMNEDNQGSNVRWRIADIDDMVAESIQNEYLEEVEGRREDDEE